ncbi:MAG: hypothetical protein JWO38_6687 [Gemmataceae bacterium]|nr:hypothetical protein [Gemmataceae bacterium]
MIPESNLIVFGVAAGVLLAALWVADGRNYVFWIRVTDGRPVVRRGVITAAFLEHVGEVCREYGVRSGWVGGVRRGRRTRLVFSRSLPPGCRQRLRNVWPLVH